MAIFTPLFQAIIAFVAVLTGLGIIFGLILEPVSFRLTSLEEGQAKLEKRMDGLEDKIDNFLKHSHKKSIVQR